MPEGKLLVVSPQGVGCNIGDDDLLAGIHGRAARSNGGADPRSVDRAPVGGRQIRRYTMLHMPAILREQQHGAEHVAGQLLDRHHERMQHRVN